MIRERSWKMLAIWFNIQVFNALYQNAIRSQVTNALYSNRLQTPLDGKKWRTLKKTKFWPVWYNHQSKIIPLPTVPWGDQLPVGVLYTLLTGSCSPHGTVVVICSCSCLLNYYIILYYYSIFHNSVSVVNKYLFFTYSLVVPVAEVSLYSLVVYYHD